MNQYHQRMASLYLALEEQKEQKLYSSAVMVLFLLEKSVPPVDQTWHGFLTLGPFSAFQVNHVISFLLYYYSQHDKATVIIPLVSFLLSCIFIHIAPIVECVTPKSPIYGSILDYERLNRTVVEGRVLTYQCDSGLSLTGPTNITCGNDGQWSIDPITLTCVTPTTSGELFIVYI